ncbi:MAG: metalloprotease PmbA [Chromatiales bacterium]|nr:MAG: metalloprotease PmbA [Chromatiales bacterium]
MNNTTQSDIATLSERVSAALATARDLGASQAEASASRGAGLSATVRMREVETLEYHRDQGLAVTVFFEHRKGSASTSDLDPDAVAEAVQKACSLAQYAAEDEFAGLAAAERMARDIPDLDLYHPWDLEPAAAIELATECEAAGLAADARITNSEGATLSTHSGARVYGNTHGFLAGYPSSQHSLSCAVLASENGAMERDFDYSVSRSPELLESAGAIGREAAVRAVRRLGARKLDTATVPVLYPARLARSLFGHFVGAISGGNLYRKSTFLADALNQTVFADRVNVAEQSHIPGGLASAPFDAEGVATADRPLIDAGVLRGYVLGSYYARKLGLETTGNAGGIHNLVVDSTGESYDDLLAGMDRGLLLTELMGQGVNTVTGDYSRGAAGFWVEHGELCYPVNEITVAGNLADMYKQIEAVGTDVDLRGGIRTGSVLVGGMTIAGN